MKSSNWLNKTTLIPSSFRFCLFLAFNSQNLLVGSTYNLRVMDIEGIVYIILCHRTFIGL